MSGGMRPESCSACPLHATARGFCLDVGDPAAARIAICLETPAAEEINFSILPPPGREVRQVLGTVQEARTELQRRGAAYPDIPASLRARGVPVVGRTGALLNRLLREAGLDRDKIFLSNILRCFPVKSKKGDTYPTGADKTIAQSLCRQYDRIGTGEGKFSPDVIVVTMHPASLFKDGASSAEPLILADLQKAASFAADGLRVLVLMGGHAAEVMLGFGVNCFHANTVVWMADGSWKRIYKIRAGEKVFAEVDGQIVRRTVTDTYKKVIAGTKWLRVDVDGGYRRNQNRLGDGGVVCTPEHEWFTRKGKKRADQLQIGDAVLIPAQGHDALIHGTLLADGYLSPTGDLQLCHTNWGWAQVKAECLGVEAKPFITNGYKPGCPAWAVRSRVGRFWREKIYVGKQKIWSEPSLTALAVIYQDNGSIVRQKNYKNTGVLGGREINYGASFAMHAFLPELEEITAWFRMRFGSAHHDKLGSVKMGCGSARKFFEEVAAFIHPANYYKLPPEFRGRYNGWMKGSILSGRVVKVEEAKIQKRHRQPNTQYCLTTESGNFFTRCGLVANCTKWRGHYEWTQPQMYDWYGRRVEKLKLKADKAGRVKMPRVKAKTKAEAAREELADSIIGALEKVVCLRVVACDGSYASLAEKDYFNMRDAIVAKLTPPPRVKKVKVAAGEVAEPVQACPPREVS